MTTEQIKAIQAKIGAEPDGFWGEKSIIACKKYLRKLMDSCKDVLHIPKTDQNSLTAAYGLPGDISQLVNLDVQGLGVKYNGQAVKTIKVNKACSVSLYRIIRDLATIPEGKIALSQYAGCYNNRAMRGGSLPSLHARGSAIDLMQATNRNQQSWPVSADMPFSVIEVFAKHGWLSAGAFWSRDAMHMQRTK
jgi:hypothetical protein